MICQSQINKGVITPCITIKLLQAMIVNKLLGNIAYAFIISDYGDISP